MHNPNPFINSTLHPQGPAISRGLGTPFSYTVSFTATVPPLGVTTYFINYNPPTPGPDPPCDGAPIPAATERLKKYDDVYVNICHPSPLFSPLFSNILHLYPTICLTPTPTIYCTPPQPYTASQSQLYFTPQP